MWARGGEHATVADDAVGFLFLTSPHFRWAGLLLGRDDGSLDELTIGSGVVVQVEGHFDWAKAVGDGRFIGVVFEVAAGGFVGS